MTALELLLLLLLLLLPSLFCPRKGNDAVPSAGLLAGLNAYLLN